MRGNEYRAPYLPETCSEEGHVDGCPGKAGGDHELRSSADGLGVPRSGLPSTVSEPSAESRHRDSRRLGQRRP